MDRDQEKRFFLSTLDSTMSRTPAPLDLFLTTENPPLHSDEIIGINIVKEAIHLHGTSMGQTEANLRKNLLEAVDNVLFISSLIEKQKP